MKLEMYPPLSQTLSQEVVNTQVNNSESLFVYFFLYWYILLLILESTLFLGNYNLIVLNKKMTI